MLTINLMIIGILILATTIYSYTESLGDNNTVTMYYDEPICDSAEGYESNYDKCDKLYDELEEEDEEEHKEESKEWEDKDEEED